MVANLLEVFKNIEGEDCPYCPNQGWYIRTNPYTGEPEQEQRQWCETIENSKFNLQKAKDGLSYAE